MNGYGVEELTGTLENWSVRGGYNVYQPPENQMIVIGGEIHGDTEGRWQDGHRISTSKIVGVEGRVVITSSGSRYLLGKVATEYMEWCEEQDGYIPTDEEPIKFSQGNGE